MTNETSSNTTGAFNSVTAASAYDVNLLVPTTGGGITAVSIDAIGNIAQLNDPAFRNLDVEALQQIPDIGIIDPSTTYYSFEQVIDVAQNQYNNAINGAKAAHSELSDFLGNDDNFIRAIPTNDITDQNSLYWEDAHRDLKAMMDQVISSYPGLIDVNAKNMDKMPEDDVTAAHLVSSAYQALTNLEDAGAFASDLAGISFDHYKPSFPDEEVNRIDLSQYEMDDASNEVNVTSPSMGR